MVENGKTVIDENASVVDRVIAGVSLLSEALPVSVGDVKDVYKGGKAVLGIADDAGDIVKKTDKLRESAKTGQEAHRQIQKELTDFDPDIKTEVPLQLKDRNVRKDAQRPDKTYIIIKPDTPSGQRSARAREKLMKDNNHKTETILYNPNDPKYQPGSSTYIGPKK